MLCPEGRDPRRTANGAEPSFGMDDHLVATVAGRDEWGRVARHGVRFVRAFAATVAVPSVVGRAASLDGADSPTGHCAVHPPSTGTFTPVMYDASSEARNAATLAISSGCAIRPIGV